MLTLGMDRVSLMDRLAKARRHVAEGERALARQRAVIQKLLRDGHNTQSARALLGNLEATQALHINHLNRVRAELSKGDGA
jgi:hypothetical protein